MIKKPSILRLICILLVSLLILSCNSFKPFEVKSYRNFSIDKIGFSKTVLKVELEIYNPNVFGLELNRAVMDIYINGQLLGHTDQPVQVRVPRRQNFWLPVSIELDMKNMLRNIGTALLNKEVTVRAVGTVRAGKGKIMKTIPFDYSSKQNISPFF
jgi:LEA14-like dessication related protein